MTAKSTKTRIIKIGNSQGMRIPKLLLEQLGLVHEVGLEVQQNQLVIRSVKQARQNWPKQFRIMAQRGDDRLLIADSTDLTNWDNSEWEWQ